MKKATIRDLRYNFSKVETLLEEGEEIEITRRKRVIARLLPPRNRPPSERPDYLKRLRKIYGSKAAAVSGADLVSEERNRF